MQFITIPHLTEYAWRQIKLW